MACRRSDLRAAFFVPGTSPFRVSGYGTDDRLEEMLAPGYFRAASGVLRPSDPDLGPGAGGRRWPAGA